MSGPSSRKRKPRLLEHRTSVQRLAKQDLVTAFEWPTPQDSSARHQERSASAPLWARDITGHPRPPEKSDSERLRRFLRSSDQDPSGYASAAWGEPPGDHREAVVDSGRCGGERHGGKPVTKRRLRLLLLTSGVLISAIDNYTASSLPQEPTLSPNAPKDRPADVRGEKEAERVPRGHRPVCREGSTNVSRCEEALFGRPPSRTSLFCCDKLAR